MLAPLPLHKTTTLGVNHLQLQFYLRAKLDCRVFGSVWLLVPRLLGWADHLPAGRGLHTETLWVGAGSLSSLGFQGFGSVFFGFLPGFQGVPGTQRLLVDGGARQGAVGELGGLCLHGGRLAAGFRSVRPVKGRDWSSGIGLLGWAGHLPF